jgi:hypothetical protein
MLRQEQGWIVVVDKRGQTSGFKVQVFGAIAFRTPKPTMGDAG